MGRVTDTTTEAPEAAEAAAPKRMVRFKNDQPFVARELRDVDWASVGAGEMKTVLWNAENNWAIPADEFTPAALEYLKNDPSFVVES